MSRDIPSIPSGIADDLRWPLVRMREELQALLGFGPAERAALTQATGGAGSTTVIVQEVTGGGGGTTPDLTPPPTPSSFAAVAGLSQVLISWSGIGYPQGNGHKQANLYGVQRDPASVAPLPTFGDAQRIYVAPNALTITAIPSDLNRQWHLWLTFETNDGVEGSPAGGTNGATVTTGKIGNADLNDLIVTAGKLADGSITATKLAAAAVEATKFAAGIEPVTIVSAVPGALVTRSVFNTTDGKMYRWNGSAYVASVPAVDITGQLADAQIAALAATKITGQVVSSQIADAAITTAKFAAGIEPVEIVASLPASGNFEGRIAYLTTDNKLYRHDGAAWLSSVPSTDITGQLGDAQLAAISAAKLTGQITTTQITDDAITTAKVAAGAITTGEIAAGTITAGNIAAGAITSTQIGAGAVTTAKLSAGAVTANELAANSVVAGKVQAGAISAAELAAGAVTTAKLTAGAVTATELAAGAVTTAKLTAGAVTANELAANAVIASKIQAGAVTTAAMTANTISGDRIAANSLDASKITANSVTAGQIQAGAIGAAQIAANAISTRNLLVANPGASLLPDSTFEDQASWSNTYGGTLALFKTVTDAPAGRYVAYTPAGVTARALQWFPGAGVNCIPVDRTKQYRLSFWYRAPSGASGSTFYATTQERDSAGALIGANGGHNFYLLANLSVPSTWTKVELFVGAGSPQAFSATTRFISPSFLLNWETAGNEVQIADVRLVELVTASLIVDGSITATKIAANAIAVGTAAIQNGAIVNAMLGNAVIDDAKIASLSAVKLTAGTLDAARIGAGTITADKLSVTSLSAIAASMGALSVDGALTMGTTGHLKGGQTAYATGSGFFLGFSGGAYKLSIGSGANMLTWDGSALTLGGIVNATGGSIGGIVIGSNFLRSSNYVANSTGFNLNATTGEVEANRITVRSGTATSQSQDYSAALSANSSVGAGGGYQAAATLSSTGYSRLVGGPVLGIVVGEVSIPYAGQMVSASSSGTVEVAFAANWGGPGATLHRCRVSFNLSIWSTTAPGASPVFFENAAAQDYEEITWLNPSRLLKVPFSMTTGKSMALAGTYVAVLTVFVDTFIGDSESPLFAINPAACRVARYSTMFSNTV